MELGDSKGEDDGENRCGNVSKKDGHKDWDFPVFAGSDNQVQVSSKLISLHVSMFLVIFAKKREQ